MMAATILPAVLDPGDDVRVVPLIGMSAIAAA
jgi:hypothetical protein